MSFFSKLFKTDNHKVITETKEYEYTIENVDKKELQKIFNTEFSIIDIYLRPYKNNTAIKVLNLKNDKIIGDIKEKDVAEILSLGFKTGQIIVDNYINDEGLQVFKGTVLFKSHK